MKKESPVIDALQGLVAKHGRCGFWKCFQRLRLDCKCWNHKLIYYLAGELKQYLDQQSISHTRGRPYHPMTQGKTERYHRTLENVVNLENYYLPWRLEHKIGEFVQYYNHKRLHESLDKLTPADVYNGRDKNIKAARDLVKEQTMRRRRHLNMGLQPLKEELIKPAILRQCVC